MTGTAAARFGRVAIVRHRVVHPTKSEASSRDAGSRAEETSLHRISL
jgi:hypothetical protein